MTPRITFKISQKISLIISLTMNRTTKICTTTPKALWNFHVARSRRSAHPETTTPPHSSTTAAIICHPPTFCHPNLLTCRHQISTRAGILNNITISIRTLILSTQATKTTSIERQISIRILSEMEIMTSRNITTRKDRFLKTRIMIRTIISEIIWTRAILTLIRVIILIREAILGRPWEMVIQEPIIILGLVRLVMGSAITSITSIQLRILTPNLISTSIRTSTMRSTLISIRMPILIVNQRSMANQILLKISPKIPVEIRIL